MTQCRTNIDKIGQKDKDIVFGYIRRLKEELFSDMKDNPYYNIQQFLQNICLLYFHKSIDTKILTDEEYCSKIINLNLKILSIN